ncbi:MAG: DUF72 domain-containing protein [Acidobacteriota bacterium]
MSSIHIGTSGWYYQEWTGTFYPSDLDKSDWLPFYAQHFTTVEINSSFYRLPFENMVKGWRNKAPKGFVYAVKGNRRITHFRKLEGVKEDSEIFIRRVSGLKEHLGPILWQLPPNLQKDTGRLDKFLATLPVNMRHAVEFRHPSWLDDKVLEILRKHGVASVSVSSLKMPVDFAVTADFIYFRFHGLEGGYAHDYSSRELQPWADQIQRAKDKKIDAYVYFNNDSNTRAPKNARDLMKLIRIC